MLPHCSLLSTIFCALSLCLAWPKYQKLIGHRNKVTCLLYPYGEHDRYTPEHFVSGSADFTVKLWNLTSGALLTSFSANGGEILRLTCTPPECSVSGNILSTWSTGKSLRATMLPQLGKQENINRLFSQQ